MDFSDRICEECSHWDDINGCWAGGPGRGMHDMACPMYLSAVYDELDDLGPDFAVYGEPMPEPSNAEGAA